MTKESPIAQKISGGLVALCTEPRTKNKYISYHNIVFIIIYIGPLDTSRFFSQEWQINSESGKRQGKAVVGQENDPK